jgi:hypothetical protein
MRTKKDAIYTADMEKRKIDVHRESLYFLRARVG